jgi:PUA domain protein
MPTQRRYPLKSKDAKQLKDVASAALKMDLDALFDSKAIVEVIESDVGEVYLLSGKPVLFKVEKRVLPTLLFSEYSAKAPKIVVDMGAIPYICKGATVMAPGIMRVEGEFGVGDLALVVDMKHGKALAVGEALMDAATARATRKGPVVKTLHYVSDKVWDYIKTVVE